MIVRAWPVFGRDVVVSQVVELLSRGVNVVLTGAAGIGKTTLASTASAAYAGRVVPIVGSPGSSAIPLAPLTSLIGDAIGHAAIVAARAALDVHRGPESDSLPPLLVVDDINAIDDQSITVLHQLLAGGECQLLATVRRGVATTPAVDRLRRSLNTVEVTVEPLHDSAIVAAAEAAIGGPLTGPTRSRLTAAAAGNPMYARALVEGSLAAGTLVSSGDGYSFRGDPVGTLQLEELVLARLAPLEADQQRALEFLAVAGALPYGVLKAVVPERHIEALERDGLIRARPDKSGLIIDVGHPLYSDMTRARLGALTRMRIHRELADAMEVATPPTSRSADDQLRQLTWSLRSGARLDPSEAVAAARRAAAIGQTELAAELSNHAAENSQERDPAQWAEAAIFAAHCASITGRHHQAVSLLSQVKPHLTDPWRRTAVLIKLAEEVWGTGDLAAGAAALAEAAALGGESTALVAANTAVQRVLGGDITGGIAMAEPLLTHPHPGVRYSACVAATTALIFSDQADRAIEVATAYLAAPGETDIALVGDPGMPQALLLMAQIVAGDVASAGDAARQRFELSPLESSAQANAWASMLVGMASEAAGDMDWAARTLAEAEPAWAALGIWGSTLWSGSLLVRALAQRGDQAGASEALSRITAYPIAPGYIGNRYLPFAQAWVATLAGEPATAAAAVAAVLREAHKTGQWTGWFEAEHEAARLVLLDHLPDLGHLQADVPPPRGRLTRARAAFVSGIRQGDADLLMEVAEAFRACGTTLYAAEAAAAARSIRLAAGDARGAGAAERLAEAMRAEVPSAVTPLLGAKRSATGPLSTREHEIADLAARGLSNRAIAKRLYVSERTVENHLYRVFIKLGISARDQLPAALGLSHL